jgi:hypothetical protein
VADTFESESKATPESGIDDESARDEGDEDGETSEKDDSKLIEEARARFKLAMEAEKDTRLLAAEDRRFRKGDQWPDEIKAAREREGRPCLTINKIPQFEQQVTNDQRQNRVSIKVHPVDDAADVETAKIYQGIIKHIEVASCAETARDTAFENAVRGSYGFYRVTTEFCDPMSFDQDIRIKRIRDPDTVLLDPYAQEPDGSDAEWGFVFEDMPKDQFCAEFGESKLAKSSEWELEGRFADDWVKADSVVVAEYFYKDYETKTLVLLSDGQVLEKSEALDLIKASKAQTFDEQGQPVAAANPLKILKERETRVPTVKWCKLNGLEILDKTDWLGQWIPILPVYGAELVVDGKVIRESLIRHAKEPSRMYNFWKSAETEAITLAPKAPFIAAEGQIEGYEALWEAANRKNFSVLPYKPKSIDGLAVPPPQRNAFEPAVQAITQASMMAGDEIKATIGIYDASLGARSNETSGRAIIARNNQAQTSNFHFNDNLNRTIRHEGRVLVDLIPKIYDTSRIARIIGEEGEQKLVPINQPYQDPKTGETRHHDLGAGKYDVTLDTGPTYATKRLEAADFMQNMVKAYPPTMQLAGDLVVKNMDVPGASELAERFKKSISAQSPGLIEDDKQKGPQIPPQVQAQMKQMGQMVDQLTAKLHEAHDVIDQKRIEIESRERIEMAKLQVEVELGMAKMGSAESMALLKHEVASIANRLSLLHMGAPIPGGADPSAQSQDQSFAPDTQAGGQSALQGQGAPMPTGGQSPGLPMEQSSDDPNGQ